jgi:3-hydroxybutyryl-CoA dehydratase
MPFADFLLGQVAEVSRTISAADIDAFAQLTGDDNPVHLDEAFAAQTQFGGRIAHGMLSAGLISAVLGTQLPGPGAIYLGQSLRFVAPVRPGDTITARVEVIELWPEKRRIRLQTTCTNQEGETVIHGDAQMLLLA